MMDYIKRMEEELNALTLKINGAKGGLDSTKIVLDYTETTQLEMQLDAMETYAKILQVRIDYALGKG